MEVTGTLDGGNLEVTMDAEEILSLRVESGDAGKELREIVVAAALRGAGRPGSGVLVGWTMESFMPLGLVVRFDAPVTDPTGTV